MTGVPPTGAAQRRFGGMRSRLLGGFDQTCTIATPGPRVSNGAGGWRDGPPIVQPNVRCEVRFPAASPQTPGKEAIETTLSRVEVRLPVGTSVSVDSRIFVGGSAYDVQGHDSGRSYASEILCDCLRSGDGLVPPPLPPAPSDLFTATFRDSF